MSLLTSKKNSIGGNNTAKRKIKIREYLQEQTNLKKSRSNPFEDDDEFINIQKSAKTVPKKTYTFDSFNLEKKENIDEILAPNINLDEADKFTASLKLPKKKSLSEINQNLKKTSKKKRFFIPEPDFTTFQEESEKLRALCLSESQDPEEIDEDLLI